MSPSLLDLPQEVQDNIYNKYFEGSHIEVRNDQEIVPPSQPESGVGFTIKNHFFFSTKLDLNIYLVCRKVYQDAKRVRNAIQNQTLITDMSWSSSDSEALLDSDRYAWLHSTVAHVQFPRFTRYTPEFWDRFLGVFRKVQTFDLTLETTRYGRAQMSPLLEQISNDAYQGDANSFEHHGAVSLAEVLHRKWSEDYSIIATEICNWHFNDNSRLKCQFTYDVRVDGCHLIEKIIDI